MIVRRHTTHLVVNGRDNRNGLANRINVGKLDGNLTNRWQTLVDGISAKMVKLQNNVAAIRAAPTTLFDFLVHATRDEVSRCQIFQGRCIALHETLTVFVKQNAAFTPNAFSNQNARAGHTGGVELPKLHVLQCNASTRCHAHAVTRIDKGIGRSGPDTTCTTRGQHSRLGLQNVDVASLHLECRYTKHVAVIIAD